MGNRKISSDLKECALNLWDKGWAIKDIIDALGVGRSSVYRWQEIFEEHGSVIRPASRLKGKERIITRAILTAVQTLYEVEADLYLDEVVLWLAVEHNIAISTSALHATLNSVGLTRNILHKIAIERDEELREQWRAIQTSEYFLDNGSQFICIDETSKNECMFARKYGQAYSGERAELKDVFVRGDRYSLVAALTVDGYIATHVVPGSLDSMDFLEFIQEEVLPQMNPYPDARSILVLDDCRIHHNDALVDMVRAAGCLILYLPVYSPDFNPIEESFSALKAYLRRHGFAIRQEEDAINALLEACGCITPEMAIGWFKHAGYIR